MVRPVRSKSHLGTAREEFERIIKKTDSQLKRKSLARLGLERETGLWLVVLSFMDETFVVSRLPRVPEVLSLGSLPSEQARNGFLLASPGNRAGLSFGLGGVGFG